jgi:hypothetical protein
MNPNSLNFQETCASQNNVLFIYELINTIIIRIALRQGIGWKPVRPSAALKKVKYEALFE